LFFFGSDGLIIFLIASESLQREVAALKQHVAAADVLTVAADLTKEEEVKKSFETIRNWGTIEVFMRCLQLFFGSCLTFGSIGVDPQCVCRVQN